MYHALYNALAVTSAPLLKAWLALRPRHRALCARFAPPAPPEARGGVWFHACSVGEVTVALPIAKAFQRRFPAIPQLLTTSTVGGRAYAESAGDRPPLTWCPADTPGAVRGFLDRLEPRMLVLVETELWPNLLRECQSRGIPVIIVNARLSDYYFPRFRRLRPLLAPLLRQVTAVMAQTEVYAERFAALGTPRDRIHVTGNTKFDGAPKPLPQEARDALRARCGIPADAPVIVFGSTHPGDETAAAACYERLRGQYPDLRLIVAPRHTDRVDDAIAPLGGAAVRWTARQEEGSPDDGPRVLLVDTVGELNAFYSLATVAVVAGSFEPRGGGHNPIEPAAQGAPVLFGPKMATFQDSVHILKNAGAAIQVTGRDALNDEIARLLGDAPQRRAMGAAGLEAVNANRGAIERIVNLTEPHLAG